MGKYRKKPVEVEAMRVPWGPGEVESDDDLIPWGALLVWLGAGGPWSVAEGGNGIDIKTLEGTMHAKPGDWIIRGVKGELYPCKPDIFEQTYEAVEAKP